MCRRDEWPGLPLRKRSSAKSIQHIDDGARLVSSEGA
jgi:hypothetical protein